MIHHKEIVSVTISGSSGTGFSNRVSGIIEQMIILPLDSNQVEVVNARWNLSIKDSDLEEIDKYINQVGRMDNRIPLPIGRDQSDIMTFSFSSVTNSPAKIRIVLKIKETA